MERAAPCAVHTMAGSVLSYPLCQCNPLSWASTSDQAWSSHEGNGVPKWLTGLQKYHLIPVATWIRAQVHSYLCLWAHTGGCICICHILVFSGIRAWCMGDFVVPKHRVTGRVGQSPSQQWLPSEGSTALPLSLLHTVCPLSLPSLYFMSVFETGSCAAQTILKSAV